MRLGRGVGAREQKALVRVVRTPRPGFLPAEDPFAVALLGLRAKSGQVASRIGLAEALAEDHLSAQDLLDVRLLLPVGTHGYERRGEEGDAEAAEDARRADASHLRLVDRLHDRGGGPPARFPGPRSEERRVG